MDANYDICLMLCSFTNNEKVHYDDWKEYEAKEHTNQDTLNNKQETGRKTNIKSFTQRLKTLRNKKFILHSL